MAKKKFTDVQINGNNKWSKYNMLSVQNINPTYGQTRKNAIAFKAQSQTINPEENPKDYWEAQRNEYDTIANDPKTPKMISKAAKVMIVIIGTILSVGVMKASTKGTLDLIERTVKSPKVQNAIKKVINGINSIKKPVANAAEDVGEKSKSLFAKFKTSKVYTKTAEFLGKAWNWVKNSKFGNFVKNLYNKVAGWAEKGTEKAKEAANTVKEKAAPVTDKAKRAANTVKEKAAPVADKAKRAANTIKEKAKNITGEQIKDGVATGVGVASGITAGAVGAGVIADPSKPQVEE